MTDIATLTESMKCLMLRHAHQWVQYLHYDIYCPELDTTVEDLKKAIGYHWRLISGCSLGIEELCSMEAFAKQGKCMCPDCSNACPSFLITDTTPVVACDDFQINELIYAV